MDGEVIALSSHGDWQDVQRTRERLGITFRMIPAPVEEVAKAFGVWGTYKPGRSFATVIIDKGTVVRFVYDRGEADRASFLQIRKVLEEIKGRV